jgi:hypothetical protein
MRPSPKSAVLLIGLKGFLSLTLALSPSITSKPFQDDGEREHWTPFSRAFDAVHKLHVVRGKDDDVSAAEPTHNHSWVRSGIV